MQHELKGEGSLARRVISVGCGSMEMCDTCMILEHLFEYGYHEACCIVTSVVYG